MLFRLYLKWSVVSTKKQSNCTKVLRKIHGKNPKGRDSDNWQGNNYSKSDDDAGCNLPTRKGK